MLKKSIGFLLFGAANVGIAAGSTYGVVQLLEDLPVEKSRAAKKYLGATRRVASLAAGKYSNEIKVLPDPSRDKESSNIKKPSI